MEKLTRFKLFKFIVMIKKIETISAIILILGLGALAIYNFNKNKVIDNSINSKEIRLQDSIIRLNREITMSHLKQVLLEKQYDSLLTLDPHVITRTNEKIKFIYSTATPDQLDSIIRTTWKTNLRHN